MTPQKSPWDPLDPPGTPPIHPWTSLTPPDPRRTPEDSPYSRLHTQFTMSFGLCPSGGAPPPPEPPNVTRYNAHAFYHVCLGKAPPPKTSNKFAITLKSAVADLRAAHLDIYTYYICTHTWINIHIYVCIYIHIYIYINMYIYYA